MDLFQILFLVGWVVGSGTLGGCFCRYMWWIPRETTLLRIAGLQFLLLPTYFAVFVLDGPSLIWGSLYWNLLVLLGLSLHLPWLFRRVTKTTWLSATTFWVVCVLSPYIAFKIGSQGTHFDFAPPRMEVMRSIIDTRGIGGALVCHYLRESDLPFPVDDEGKKVPSIHSTPEDKSSLLYFAGPSFVPKELAGVGELDKIPVDPFAEKRNRTYSYGMGADRFGDATYILSSPGPDEVNESEELEGLFLYVHEGNRETFEKDPQVWHLQYSPTNGSWSPGEILQAGVAREGGVWW